MSVEQATPSGLSDIPEPAEILPLTPRLRVRGSVPPEINPETLQPEGPLLTFVSHRFGLRPDAEAVENDPDIFDGRARETHYVYRRGLGTDTATLHAGVHGVEERGVYGVPTRGLARHWGELLSFATHHGEWVLARFPDATSTPPETISRPRSEKPRSRRLMPPRRPHIA